MAEITQEQLYEYWPTELNVNQRTAILALVNDITLSVFLTSNIPHHIENNNFQCAANAFLNYVKVGRIVSAAKVAQRNAEKQLFLTLPSQE